jgi:hypothetical protein
VGPAHPNESYAVLRWSGRSPTGSSPSGASISDVVIEALSGDPSGIGGLLSAWTALVVMAAVDLLASAPSLPVGDGVAVIALTSVAAKMSRIVAGVVAFGDRLMAICWWWARTRHSSSCSWRRP